MVKALSEEEVFADDKDPMEAIMEIRRAEGVAEEDLPELDSDTSGEPEITDGPDGEDELDELEEDDKQDSGSDTDSETPDGEVGQEGEDDEDDTSAEKASDEESEEPAPVVKKFKANGQEFEFTDTEIMEQFEQVFGKAMDYTQKMQQIAPFRKMISALETEGVTSEQLNTAIDALKGNKDALKNLLEKNNIDPYDLADEDEEKTSPYVPPEFGKNEVQLGIEDVVKNISTDPEYRITVDVIDKQWDQTSRASFASNPQLIAGLHSDIKSGMFDKVAPVAMKMKVLDGNTKSDIEYYMAAGQQVIAQEQLSAEKQTAEKTVNELNKQGQSVDEEFDQASSEASKKRSASTTRKRSDKGVTDYLDDDDEAFDDWYKNVMSKV